MIQVTWNDEKDVPILYVFETFAQAAVVMEELINDEIPFKVTYGD